MRIYLSLSIILLIIGFTNALKAQAPHSLPKLPYAYNALEPYIDSTTMFIHYNKHHSGYINNLNAAVENTDLKNLSLEDLLANVSSYSTTIRNNAGGAYNHNLFWNILSPNLPTTMHEDLKRALVKDFGSIEAFNEQLMKAASSQFGSGWAWLSVDANGNLFISATPNQDNPLMDVVEKRGTPILGIDVWEHAYYLKYQNKRVDYLRNLMTIINWDTVSKNYVMILKNMDSK